MPDFPPDFRRRLADLESRLADVERTLDRRPERAAERNYSCDWHYAELTERLSSVHTPAKAKLAYEGNSGWTVTTATVSVHCGYLFGPSDELAIGQRIRIRWQPVVAGRTTGLWYVVSAACWTPES